MFESHAREISREALKSPRAFRDVCLFVLGTIQEPLERMDEIMREFREMGAGSRYAWGMKARGIRDIDANYERLHSLTLHAMATRSPMWRERLILAYMDSIHGINVAKAGFIAQLVTNSVGCLDSHNRRRYGLPGRYRIAPELKQSTRIKKIHDYVRLCDKLGGCAHLWDSWCAYVAEKRPAAWSSAESVSAAHLLAVYPF